PNARRWKRWEMISLWHKVAGLIALTLIILFRLNVMVQFIKEGNTGAALVEAVVISLLMLVGIGGLRIPTKHRDSINGGHIGHSSARENLSATSERNTTDQETKRARAKRDSLAIVLMI